jgi:peptidoglycan L-alanyl-D-glutamate endopeptidase CwlK
MATKKIAAPVVEEKNEIKPEPIVVLPEIWGRVSLAELYPPFAAKLQLLVDACAARGTRYYATSGLRSLEAQAKLYAQGRTEPGKIVTKAKPGQSFHNFAIAMDFCRDADTDRSGLQPDWDLDAYKILAEEATKVGLESAYYWDSFKEGPHVQLPVARHGITLAMLRSIHAQTGQKGVEHLLNKYQW